MIACDLGSNTIRFVEIDCKSRKRVKEFEKIVRTADGIKSSGVISEGAKQRIFEAISEASSIFDFSKGIVGVATEALRIAKNGNEFLKQIREKFGIDFEIIDGKREAFYTNIAVREIVDTKSYILVDIGGGSTEVSFVYDDKIISQSFDLGIVTIVQEYGLKNLNKGIKEKISLIKKRFEKLKKTSLLVATSGTPTTISSYILGMDYESYDYEKINGYLLSLKEVQKVKKDLIFMGESERKRWVGVGREDLIVAGIEIFEELMKAFDFWECVVVDNSLREGVALYNCKNRVG